MPDNSLFGLHPEHAGACDLFIETLAFAITPLHVPAKVRHALLGNGNIAVEPDNGLVCLGDML